jgi:hypothetical protein
MKGHVRGMMSIMVVAALTIYVACAGRQTTTTTTPNTDEGEVLTVAPDISKRLEQFAPVEIDVAPELITEELRPVLAKLVHAADLMDEIYLSQVSTENPQLRERLAASPEHADALAYFDIMYGPWDRLDHGAPFIGEAPRPPGASFYPADLTSEELRAYIEAHPDQREALTSYFTVIRRNGEALEAVPYSQVYREQLEAAAQSLREAASLSSDARLTRYLETRAQAFLSDDYYESDIAWMELGDCPIEIVIGPYEVYEDELMGMRASFEAFVTIRDPEASQRLERISELAETLERALPVEERHRNTGRGETRPISVVYVVMTAGDTRAGVQTLAFNLPNDERVREGHGYKLVLLRNVMEAKYNMILLPIAQRLVVEEQLSDLSFDAFLSNTLMHESAHGLGPGTITREDGTETNVNQELRELYSTIEEAKADIVGLFTSQFLIDQGELPRELERQMYATFLAGFFRSVRFGAGEAHGRANMIQFNYLMEHNAIEVDDEGRYRVNYENVREAVRELARELLTIEGDGDYERAQAFIERYGAVTDQLRAALGQLGDIPVDIRPSYPAADRLRDEN